MIVTLIAPQRTGKSTLAARLVKELKCEGHYYFNYNDLNIEAIPIEDNCAYIFDDAYSYLTGEYSDSNLVQNINAIIAARGHRNLTIIFVFANANQYPSWLYGLNNILIMFPSTKGKFNVNKYPEYEQANTYLKKNDGNPIKIFL
jgi:hypothetical protein